MRISEWKGAAEFVGIAAILAGLIFVYMEIQQNGDIARAELASGTAERIDAVYQHLADPHFSLVYAKSLHVPDELTEAERIRLNAFLERVFRIFGREWALYSMGVSDNFEIIPTQIAPVFYRSGYGKIWWSIRKETVAPQLVETIDRALVESNGRESFIEIDSRIRERLGRQ